MEIIVASTGLMDHAAFDALISLQFADAAAELDVDDRKLLHMEMAAVARSTSRAIESGNVAEEARHFDIMESVLIRAVPSVQNAVHVSYLENIFLGETRRVYLDARSRLPPRLAKALLELEEHFARLADSARGA